MRPPSVGIRAMLRKVFAILHAKLYMLEFLTLRRKDALVSVFLWGEGGIAPRPVIDATGENIEIRRLRVFDHFRSGICLSALYLSIVYLFTPTVQYIGLYLLNSFLNF